MILSNQAKRCGGPRNIAWAHEIGRSALKRTNKIDEKTSQNGCKFTIRNKQYQKRLYKSDLGASGASFGRVWGRFGERLEALGASWAAFRVHFFMLVFGVVFKSAPGGFFAGSWVDFSRFGRDLGRVLGWFWRDSG